MRDRLLAEHRSLLERWRESMNLVGPGPLDEHYLDARLSLAGLDPVGRWADLGTGAGFPGVVLAAMYPGVEVDMVDSRRKRCMFLEEVIERSGATGLRVRCQRIEELPAHAWEGVTARALAPAVEVLAMADRLLVPGGRCVLFLQDDGQNPEHAAFELEGERAYRLGEHRRRSRVYRRIASL